MIFCHRMADVFLSFIYFCLQIFSVIFLLSFFFCLLLSLLSALAERNSTKISHMLGSEFNFKIHVRNLGYPTTQIGDPKTTFFRRLCNLNGNFNGLYLPNETRYTKLGRCVDNYKGSPAII